MPTTRIPAPRTIEETGVRRSLLEDLALKTLYLTGEMSLHELAGQMALTLSIADELFQRLRKEQLCQVTGMDKGVHRITTTSGGKTRALELMSQNAYTGPAPVSLADYVERVRAQGVKNMKVTPKDMNRAFEDLVLDPRTLDQLGTAVQSGRALFLYGPTGTGKTTIAEVSDFLGVAPTRWVRRRLTPTLRRAILKLKRYYAARDMCRFGLSPSARLALYS